MNMATAMRLIAAALVAAACAGGGAATGARAGEVAGASAGASAQAGSSDAPRDSSRGTSQGASSGASAPATAPKVLRYAFEKAETSFDPVKVNDIYSRTVTPHIFEALYQFDPLARPVRIRPLTAEALPEASPDFRVWTIRLRRGIHFAADPAFRGVRRELVAEDYVYTLKRFADPANKSPAWPEIEALGIRGLNARHAAAVGTGAPGFDYDAPVEGLRAVDRYTLRIAVEAPRPRLVDTLTASDLYGGVAREVVEFYGDQIDAHPVGTGPFRLVQWRRSSLIVLERNPDFREVLYDAEPAADDAEGRAILARLKGRRLPMIDRVEVSVIDEDQTRWLSFLNGEADLVYRVGFEFVNQAMPGGRVAPGLAKRGIRGYRVAEASSSFLYFNLDDPVVGGYGADRVALRRAIALGIDVPTMIAYAYNGVASVAQSVLLPFTTAFDPHLTSETGAYDVGRANALLDLYGYVDRDGDGWRDTPGGAPLVLRVATQSDQRSRRVAEVLDRSLKALHIRMQSVVAQWPENLKNARAGRLQVWSLSSSAAGPDSADALARFDSRQIGGQNFARFNSPAFDAIYDELLRLPDGPERVALFARAQQIATAYMPYKFLLNRATVDMSYPWIVGYRHPVLWQEWWQYVDIDESSKPRR